MLSTAHRLRRRGEFAATVKAGRRAGRGTIVLHLAWAGPTPEPSPQRDTAAQAGFVVPRTVGPAVRRNVVKRRLRHLVGLRLAQLPAGSRLVVRARPAAAQATFAALAMDLDQALEAALRSGPVRLPRLRGPSSSGSTTGSAKVRRDP